MRFNLDSIRNNNKTLWILGANRFHWPTPHSFPSFIWFAWLKGMSCDKNNLFAHIYIYREWRGTGSKNILVETFFYGFTEQHCHTRFNSRKSVEIELNILSPENSARQNQLFIFWLCCPTAIIAESRLFWQVGTWKRSTTLSRKGIASARKTVLFTDWVDLLMPTVNEYSSGSSNLGKSSCLQR